MVFQLALIQGCFQEQSEETGISMGKRCVQTNFFFSIKRFPFGFFGLSNMINSLVILSRIAIQLRL